MAEGRDDAAVLYRSDVGDEPRAGLGKRAHPRNFPRYVAVIVSVAALCALILSAWAVGIATRRSDAAPVSAIGANVSRSLSIRLFPGDELITGIMSVVKQRQLRSAYMVTCVGSLTQYAIRFANQDWIGRGTGHFEIVSLVGTMTSNRNVVTGTDGAWHLHISLGDGNGTTISGHLASNSTVYTTAEIVLAYDCDVEYHRAVDGSTPWDELQITQSKWC
jgi:predicted DNA-binding protein with PD1-like motif